ncbi:hypothetical protein AYL99_11707 [Fonsecaea erecta]|uniref:HNH nuclease domain-containing protein n=1 Tax=Fonsecaea erecta TaxID=1367422 RepID=A0A178Z321_9EURO|nr:hypothetical protein AYL99_11707 [Fonsecaea erecta]OAP54172.1 hypothetical protein AYL99_11707 [Fonsecaea erecta]
MPPTPKWKGKALVTPRRGSVDPPPPIQFSPRVLAQVQKVDGGEIFKTEIQPLLESASEKKINFSQLSTSSQQTFKESAKRYQNEEIDRDEHEENIRPELKRLLTSYLEALDADCESARHHMQILNNLHHRGVLDLSQAEVKNETARFDQKILDLQQNTVVLRDELSTLVGIWIDTYIRFERQSTSDLAYIDSLLARMRTPSRANLSLFKLRDVNEQHRFRTTAIKAYGADCPSNPDLIWCCISGGFKNASVVVAAHIVPYKIGEVQASYIFGEQRGPPGHIMSPGNCLLMGIELEIAFNDGRFAIVPGQGPYELKVLVLGDPRGDSTLEEIDGKVLQFQTEFRPAKRYLYFAFVVSLLRMQRCEVPGWWQTILASQDIKPFTSPGEYLRTSTLFTMAQRIGNMVPTDATEFINNGLPHPRPSTEGPRDRLAADYVSVASSSRQEEDNDDDDPFVAKGIRSRVMFGALTVEDHSEDTGDEEGEDDERNEGREEGEED